MTLVVKLERLSFQSFSVFFPSILELSANEQIHYRNVNLVPIINIGFRIFDVFLL